jgi:hypothetical protein
VASKCKTYENSGKPGRKSLYGNLLARLQSKTSTLTESAERGALVRELEADVAQLVEQLIRNQQVIGSSPIVGSRFSRFQVQ